MRRAALLLAAFGYMVLLIESLRTAVDWWHGELKEPGIAEYLLIAALPVLIWIWWRHFSMFRKDCGKAACSLPEERSGD